MHPPYTWPVPQPSLMWFLKTRIVVLLCFLISVSCVCLLVSLSAALSQSADAGGKKTVCNEFDCLPPEINIDEIVTFGIGDTPNVTVKDKLIELNARCRKGKLIDGTRREIRFVKTECWGNPPVDYLEIQERNRREIEKLKRKYTVIEIACDRLKLL